MKIKERKIVREVTKQKTKAMNIKVWREKTKKSKMKKMKTRKDIRTETMVVKQEWN